MAPPAPRGELLCNGQRMHLVSADVASDTWTAHCRAQVGAVVVDVHLRHTPGQPWALGEAVKDGEGEPIELEWQRGIILTSGPHGCMPIGSPLRGAVAGEAVSFVVVWPDLGATYEQWVKAIAALGAG